MTPEETYVEARRLQPRWGDKSPDVEQRRAESKRLMTVAAEAGHLGAIEALAGQPRGEGYVWAILLARQGEIRPLVSALTRSDTPAECGQQVLAALRAGESWAMYVLGHIYGMGLCDTTTGVNLATRDGQWGWLPGVSDPPAESTRWLEAAIVAGSAAAALSVAIKERRSDATRALARLEQMERSGGPLTSPQQQRANKLRAELLDETNAPIEQRVAAYEALAATGDMDAEFWLGERLLLGEGASPDPAAARTRFERAAASGHVHACRELGKLLESGTGGPADPARARELYEQAAELGNDAWSRDRLAEAFGLEWYSRK